MALTCLQQSYTEMLNFQISKTYLFSTDIPIFKDPEEMIEFFWEKAVAGDQLEGAIDLVRQQGRAKNVDDGFDIEEGW